MMSRVEGLENQPSHPTSADSVRDRSNRATNDGQGAWTPHLSEGGAGVVGPRAGDPGGGRGHD
jgi:hypothetical protein